MLLDIVEGYVQSTRYVADFIFFSGADIQYGYQAFFATSQELLSRYRFQAIAITKISNDDIVYFLHMPLAGTPQAAKEIDYIIAGHTVKNVKAFFAGCDQTSTP